MFWFFPSEFMTMNRISGSNIGRQFLAYNKKKIWIELIMEAQQSAEIILSGQLSFDY